MEKDRMIGVDLAKNIFQLHIASMTGEVFSKKKLSREKFKEFMQDHEPAIVVIESCGSAHYWAETLTEMEHKVKLIAPQYVKPFVKRQKNDAADAEAIVIAAQRPEMRFVEPKTKEQRAKAVIFRSRERLVAQRTELVNAMRSMLYEYGFVIPQGITNLRRAEEIIHSHNCGLPELVREECRDLLIQIAEKSDRIAQKTQLIRKLAAQTNIAQQLQTIPGVGPMTALAIEAFAPPLPGWDWSRDSFLQAAKSALGASPKQGKPT